jgi:DMSO/TMAO reductase YedYZ molybdopterin-dependent catalytic subunit
MPAFNVSRRTLITTGLATVGGLMLPGCDRLSQAPSFERFLDSAEGLTYRSQRLLQFGQPLAREFSVRDLSPTFRTNGTSLPPSPAYQVMADQGFKGWTLRIDGLVMRPLDLSLDQIKTVRNRSQITRHDCVEGWSAIGKWTGASLGALLQLAGLKPKARFIVFHCADSMDDRPEGNDFYYESIDLIDAFHPQTMMAYALNDQPLDVGHGAPLRLRVERQLGYKQAKYVMRIEAVESLASLGMGKGGYWPDQGYEWYAGA